MPGDQVDEVILGNVCGANLGQAPSSQASVAAGIPWKVPTTTVNKVCSSGMKAAMFAAQGIQLGQRHVVVAGGFESMSNVPYYVPRGRTGYAYGHGEFLDGLLKDGLWDSFEQKHMGMCAEKCAKDFQISREQQDEFAIESCKRAIEAHKAGAFRGEIVDVEIPGKKGKPHTIFNADESLLKINVEKIPSLRPAFLKEDGTVTAANASSLNDGASALVLASEEFVKAHGIKPLAKIRGYDDAAQKSVDFTTAPALAMPLALKRAGLEVKDVDLWEINEAFSVVALANMKVRSLMLNCGEICIINCI